MTIRNVKGIFCTLGLIIISNLGMAQNPRQYPRSTPRANVPTSGLFGTSFLSSSVQRNYAQNMGPQAKQLYGNIRSAVNKQASLNFVKEEAIMFAGGAVIGATIKLVTKGARLAKVLGPKNQRVISEGDVNVVGPTEYTKNHPRHLPEGFPKDKKWSENKNMDGMRRLYREEKGVETLGGGKIGLPRKDGTGGLVGMVTESEKALLRREFGYTEKFVLVTGARSGIILGDFAMGSYIAGANVQLSEKYFNQFIESNQGNPDLEQLVNAKIDNINQEVTKLSDFTNDMFFVIDFYESIEMLNPDVASNLRNQVVEFFIDRLSDIEGIDPEAIEALIANSLNPQKQDVEEK